MNLSLNEQNGYRCVWTLPYLFCFDLLVLFWELCFSEELSCSVEEAWLSFRSRVARDLL